MFFKLKNKFKNMNLYFSLFILNVGI